MDEFPGIEHRLEWVRRLDGVSYFNDSKGTNVGSVVKSLQSFEEPIILIAGGKDKGGDYGPLKDLIAERVKGMALIGEAKDRMFAALGDLTETAKLGGLEEAVRWARSKAGPGEIVLLSPACSSYDMFANYQERGKRFKEITARATTRKPRNMKSDRHMDFFILFSVLTLLGLGIVMVYSASFVLAGQRFGDSYYFLKKQAVAAAIGLSLLFFAARMDYRRWQVLGLPLLILSAALLTVLILPGMRHEIGGSARWLKISFLFLPAGGAGKAGLSHLSSALADQKRRADEGVRRWLSAPHGRVGGFFALVLKQPDFGTGIIFASLVFLMLFAAGASFKHLGATALAALPVLLYIATRAKYRQGRLLTFLNPWSDPGNAGFQIIQSFLAFGSGNVFGVGLGVGKQKLFYLPEVHTDFIFSVIGEELGLIGVAVVVGLFAVLIFRGFRACFRAPDLFGTYLALGDHLSLIHPDPAEHGSGHGSSPDQRIHPAVHQLRRHLALE